MTNFVTYSTIFTCALYFFSFKALANSEQPYVECLLGSKKVAMGTLHLPSHENTATLGLREIVTTHASPVGWIYLVNQDKKITAYMNIEYLGESVALGSFEVANGGAVNAHAHRLIEADLDGDGKRDVNLICYTIEP